jgi:hypothetical protein
MAETDEQEFAEEEYIEEERLSPWKIALAVIAVIGLVGTVIAVGTVMFLNSRGDPAEKALAKTSLQHVVTAAEAYRDDNDNVYEGLTAAKIKKAVSETVVDGTPKAGQVGIMDYNSDQLVLLYTGKSGTQYKATIKAGVIEWGF